MKVYFRFVLTSGYIGCFSNPIDPSTLETALDLGYIETRIPNYVVPLWKCAPQAMTVDLCTKQCVARGYQFAGLQGGLNCFCLTYDQVLYYGRSTQSIGAMLRALYWRCQKPGSTISSTAN